MLLYSLKRLKPKTLITLNAREDVEQQEFSSLLLGIQAGTVTMEDSSVLSY